METLATLNQVADDFKAAIQGNEALQAFCKLKWNKTVIVKRVFKNRTEINIDELPLILMTVPQIQSGTSEIIYRFRLYCGFLQNVRDNAQQEMADFSERIEDAVNLDKERNKLALYTEPKETITDEGFYHPVYFLVKDVEIIVPKV